VKKCASCAKDLPEAALHCVFCGAKQPPAPAVQPGMAKTAFGYSANEVMQELNRSKSPSSQPQYQQQPTVPQYQQPPQPQYQQPPQPQYQQPPTNAANAQTMFAPGPPPMQQQGGGYPMGSGGMQPMVPTAGPSMPTHAHGGPAAPPGMGIHSPQQLTPQPLPTAPPPYLASQTAARAGHPIEPWKDPLKLWMFVWGALTLAAFVTPVASDPMAFNWDAIIHAPGSAKLPPLIMAAVGVLSVVIAAIPMAPLARGVLAFALGLAGVFVPLFVAGMPPWQLLMPFVATIVLVPGLLVRNEYTESLLARVLATVGVVALLLPFVIPAHHGIPLVDMFKALIDAPGQAKLAPALELGLLVIAVMSLLCWMPGPATGGAKVFAWLMILWSTLMFQIGGLIVEGHIGEAIKLSPYKATMEWAPQAAYFVLIGYGLATVIGKQLE
jgi:hypothetical protein